MFYLAGIHKSASIIQLYIGLSWKKGVKLVKPAAYILQFHVKKMIIIEHEQPSACFILVMMFWAPGQPACTEKFRTVYAILRERNVQRADGCLKLKEDEAQEL